MRHMYNPCGLLWRPVPAHCVDVLCRIWCHLLACRCSALICNACKRRSAHPGRSPAMLWRAKFLWPSCSLCRGIRGHDTCCTLYIGEGTYTADASSRSIWSFVSSSACFAAQKLKKHLLVSSGCRGRTEVPASLLCSLCTARSAQICVALH